MPVTISTYNVNGIRAAERKGFSEWINQTGPDIVCLQEIKADECQIPGSINQLGYHLFCHSAEKKGYSGVAILSRIMPDQIKIGMGVDWIDSEGRILTAEFNGFRVVSVYAPSGTSGDLRQLVKYRFLDKYLEWMHKVVSDGKPTLFCGDINIAHTNIDIHDPVSNKKSTGFLPEEREWFTKMLDSGFEDVFRQHNPDLKHAYSWWTYRAGAKGNNKGWRIDYQIGNKGMSSRVLNSKIEKELNLSDHAPVTIEYNL